MNKGIYVNTATQFNTKCVVFGMALCGAYWYLPSRKNIYMLPVIFTIAYVAMAWYDQLYQCKDRLYSGSRSWGMAILDSIFKPQLRDNISDNVPPHSPPPGKQFAPNQEAVYRRYMYLFHLLVVAPLFIAIGYYRDSAFAQKLYLPMLLFVVLGFVYHLYRTVNPRPEQSRSIYLAHLFAFLPIGLYIGRKGKSSSTFAYRGILLLGIFAGLYHSIRYLTHTPLNRTEK